LHPSRDGLTFKITTDWSDVRSGAPWQRVAGAAFPRGKATRQRPGKIVEKMRAALPRGKLKRAFFVEGGFF